MFQDMSQFFQVFFEEIEEYLVIFEFFLIGFDLDWLDSEMLYGIFCVVYLIKGFSGMFGFDDIIVVIYELEILFDCICCGQMYLWLDMISFFFEVCDVLQCLFDVYCSGSFDFGVLLLEMVEWLCGWLWVLEQEVVEEGFGLFDDVFVREIVDDDVFGFFDEGLGVLE